MWLVCVETASCVDAKVDASWSEDVISRVYPPAFWVATPKWRVFRRLSPLVWAHLYQQERHATRTATENQARAREYQALLVAYHNAVADYRAWAAAPRDAEKVIRNRDELNRFRSRLEAREYAWKAHQDAIATLAALRGLFAQIGRPEPIPGPPANDLPQPPRHAIARRGPGPPMVYRTVPAIVATHFPTPHGELPATVIPSTTLPDDFQDLIDFVGACAVPEHPFTLGSGYHGQGFIHVADPFRFIARLRELAAVGDREALERIRQLRTYMEDHP